MLHLVLDLDLLEPLLDVVRVDERLEEDPRLEGFDLDVRDGGASTGSRQA